MKNFVLLLVALLALSSCSKKEYLYLADMKDGMGYAVANRHQTRIQDDDRLKITVSCKNPELAAPFNVSNAAVKVSADGDITFPILGTIHVAGMSLNEASELIRNLLIAGGYINDPIVTIEFMNFHYTVLGAVNGNGSYTVDGDKVTILEAIAKAGDLSATADLGNIAVIRESDGERKVYTVDIRSTDLFNSPAFYLAQNDIIYARPYKAKSSDDKSDRVFQWVTIALSTVTAACSVIWAVRK